MLAPKKSIDELRKKKKKQSVAEQVERIMLNETEGTHVKMIMKEHFGVKESDMEGSFSNWKRGLPALYGEILTTLQDLVKCGFLESMKDGRTVYYWKVKKPGECSKCGYIHPKDGSCISIKDIRQNQLRANKTRDITDEEIIGFLKTRSATEMEIAEHFGIPARGGPRTKLWNQLKRLVETNRLHHDYSGRRGKPYFFKQDKP
jgi:hypothetical protein